MSGNPTKDVFIKALKSDFRADFYKCLDAEKDDPNMTPQEYVIRVTQQILAMCQTMSPYYAGVRLYQFLPTQFFLTPEYLELEAVDFEGWVGPLRSDYMRTSKIESFVHTWQTIREKHKSYGDDFFVDDDGSRRRFLCAICPGMDFVNSAASFIVQIFAEMESPIFMDRACYDTMNELEKFVLKFVWNPANWADVVYENLFYDPLQHIKIETHAENKKKEHVVVIKQEAGAEKEKQKEVVVVKQEANAEKQPPKRDDRDIVASDIHPQLAIERIWDADLNIRSKQVLSLMVVARHFAFATIPKILADCFQKLHSVCTAGMTDEDQNWRAFCENVVETMKPTRCMRIFGNDTEQLQRFIPECATWTDLIENLNNWCSSVSLIRESKQKAEGRDISVDQILPIKFDVSSIKKDLDNDAMFVRLPTVDLKQWKEVFCKDKNYTFFKALLDFATPEFLAASNINAQKWPLKNLDNNRIQLAFKGRHAVLEDFSLQWHRLFTSLVTIACWQTDELQSNLVRKTYRRSFDYLHYIERILDDNNKAAPLENPERFCELLYKYVKDKEENKGFETEFRQLGRAEEKKKDVRDLIAELTTDNLYEVALIRVLGDPVWSKKFNPDAQRVACSNFLTGVIKARIDRVTELAGSAFRKQQSLIMQYGASNNQSALAFLKELQTLLDFVLKINQEDTPMRKLFVIKDIRVLGVYNGLIAVLIELETLLDQIFQLGGNLSGDNWVGVDASLTRRFKDLRGFITALSESTKETRMDAAAVVLAKLADIQTEYGNVRQSFTEPPITPRQARVNNFEMENANTSNQMAANENAIGDTVIEMSVDNQIAPPPEVRRSYTERMWEALAAYVDKGKEIVSNARKMYKTSTTHLRKPSAAWFALLAVNTVSGCSFSLATFENSKTTTKYREFSIKGMPVRFPETELPSLFLADGFLIQQLNVFGMSHHAWLSQQMIRNMETDPHKYTDEHFLIPTAVQLVQIGLAPVSVALNLGILTDPRVLAGVGIGTAAVVGALAYISTRKQGQPASYKALGDFLYPINRHLQFLIRAVGLVKLADTAVDWIYNYEYYFRRAQIIASRNISNVIYQNPEQTMTIAEGIQKMTADSMPAIKRVLLHVPFWGIGPSIAKYEQIQFENNLTLVNTAVTIAYLVKSFWPERKDEKTEDEKRKAREREQALEALKFFLRGGPPLRPEVENLAAEYLELSGVNELRQKRHDELAKLAAERSKKKIQEELANLQKQLGTTTNETLFYAMGWVSLISAHAPHLLTAVAVASLRASKGTVTLIK